MIRKLLHMPNLFSACRYSSYKSLIFAFLTLHHCLQISSTYLSIYKKKGKAMLSLHTALHLSTPSSFTTDPKHRPRYATKPFRDLEAKNIILVRRHHLSANKSISHFLRTPLIIPKAAAFPNPADGGLSSDTGSAGPVQPPAQDSITDTNSSSSFDIQREEDVATPNVTAPESRVQDQESEDFPYDPFLPPEQEEEEEEDDDEEGGGSGGGGEEEDKDIKATVCNREEEEEEEPKNFLSSNVQLALVFGLWYVQNVVFNIYNKKVLNVFPFPWLLSSFQLLVGSLWMTFLWSSGLQPFPRVSKRFLTALLGPALFHTIGHISACISFSKVAVSFTHVIKASEPVFSVIFSALHGQFYPIHVWLSVLPIVAGCSLAAVTEVSFNAQGLWGALISNVGFVLRNIYSKQSLYDFKHINGLNLYGFISIASLFYLLPVAVFVEGSQWVDGFQKAIMAVPTPWSFYSWVLLSGIFYHLYNQSSYQALYRISPLTFSVGNTMKRVIVIVSSVLVFGNPIRPLNALGSAIAVFGTFLYSQGMMLGKGQKKDDDAMVAERMA